MGTKTGRRRRPALAGCIAAGHKGSPEKNAKGRSEPIEALSPAHRGVMDPRPVTLDQPFAAASEDFPALLQRKGLLAPPGIIDQAIRADKSQPTTFTPTQATTILAFKFSGGVLVAGDRRATAGNTVVYDRADKVLEIDR